MTMLLLLLASTARGETLWLAPTADGYIRVNQTPAQTSNATNSLLLLGDTANTGDYMRIVLGFDLDQPLLEGATIHDASLVFTVSARDTASGGSANSVETLQVHAISGNFSESAVSWTARDGSTAWAAPGGDFGPALGGATANPSLVNGGESLTLTGAGFSDAVIAAAGGPCHFLVKLLTENATRTVFRLDSRSTADPPLLMINYTPADPGDPGAPPPPGPLSPGITPVPGHPESPASPRYSLTAGNHPIEVKEERFSFDVALFTLDAEAEESALVQVTVADTFPSYSLKPARHGLEVTQTGNTLSFLLDEPLRLVLQIPGRTPLAIIVTPPEVDPPSPGDPGVIYYPPGITVAGVIRPVTGETLYFAPGALVKGRIEAVDVEDLTIRGRGFLETAGYSTRGARTNGVLVENARNVLMEGIGVRSDNTFWQTLFLNSRDVLVRDVNIFGIGVNTDGVDIDAVKDFVVRDSFIRAEDDGLGWHSLDAATNGEMITERALAENIVIWNTGAGNGVRIGASMEAQLWRDITLRNLDILQHAGSGLYSDYSDWAWMRNLRFENIVIERPTSPINFRIAKFSYSNSTGYLDERGHMEGLLFENLTAAGGAIALRGFDATHRITGVRFNNCVNAGVPLTSTAQLTLNEFVEDVAFNQPLPAAAPPLPAYFEAEELETFTALTPKYITDAPEALGGKLRTFAGTAVGQYLEHALGDIPAGNYTLRLRIHRTGASGQAQLTLNGAPVGDVIDFHAADAGYQWVDLGQVSQAAAGPVSLRLTLTGKNAASSGFRLHLDSILLMTPLQTWRDLHFQTTANSGDASDQSDPDGDGARNLLEYAVASPPKSPAPSGGIFTLLPPTPEGGYLGLEFTRRDDADVSYYIEACDELGAWEVTTALTPASAGSWTVPGLIQETPLGNGLVRVSFRDTAAPPAVPGRYLRLRVDAPES